MKIRAPKPKLVLPSHLRPRTPRVALGYPFGGSLTYQFHLSLMALQRYELGKGPDGALLHHLIPQSGLYIDHNRNAIVEKFMTTDAEWLLQIDSDITFPETLIEAMLESAGADRKILAASVPLGPPLPSSAWMMTEQPGIWRAVPAQKWCPTCRNEHYSLTPHGDELACAVCLGTFSPSDQRIIEQVIVSEEGIPCDGLATAVILVHREVFEAIAEQVGQCWFLKTMAPRLSERSAKAWDGGEMRERKYISVGEDLSFCLRARDAGYQSWCAVIPGLKHHKTLPLSHDYECTGAPPRAAEA